MSAKILKEIENNRDEYLQLLSTLIAQPSISSQDEGVEECARLVQSVMIDYGLNARLIQTDSYPLVYGEKTIDEDAPTVLFYGHYDVQPADASAWSAPPFEATIRDGAVYGRGSGDNKGQFLTHILATDLLSKTAQGPAANVKILLEGEEENGSAGLIDFLDRDPEELDADLIYVADGSMHDSGRPTLIFGCRGMLGVELSRETGLGNLHSGNFGGPTPNAANELVSVVSALYEDGTVTLPNFYDDIDITERQRQAIREIPVDMTSITDQFGVDSLPVAAGEYYEQLLAEPTVSINGLASGYQGEGMKTVVPGKATAKLDFRLLPGQDPDRIFEDLESFVAAQNDSITIEKLGTFPPFGEPLSLPQKEPIIESLETVWGSGHVTIPFLPGSLPVGYFKRATETPVLVVPYANADQNNHGPDEHLDIACFLNGIATSALFLRSFGDLSIPST